MLRSSCGRLGSLPSSPITRLCPSSTPKPIQASRPQNIVLESRLHVGFFYRKTGERAAERNVCSENRTAGCGNTLVFRDDLFSAQTTRSCSASALTGLALLQTF